MRACSRISRRTALRGLGVSLALPLLEAMDRQPLRGAGSDRKSPPLRLAFVYVPNGVHMPDWTPKSVGDGSWHSRRSWNRWVRSRTRSSS